MSFLWRIMGIMGNHGWVKRIIDVSEKNGFFFTLNVASEQFHVEWGRRFGFPKENDFGFATLAPNCKSLKLFLVKLNAKDISQHVR